MSPLVPTDSEIDRETLLDVTVNLIPMGILLFFIVLFLVYIPFSPDLFATVVSHALTIIPLVLLGFLTYVSAKVIARDERKLEEEAAAGTVATTDEESDDVETIERPNDADASAEGTAADEPSEGEPAADATDAEAEAEGDATTSDGSAEQTTTDAADDVEPGDVGTDETRR